MSGLKPKTPKGLAPSTIDHPPGPGIYLPNKSPMHNSNVGKFIESVDKILVTIGWCGEFLVTPQFYGYQLRLACPHGEPVVEHYSMEIFEYVNEPAQLASSTLQTLMAQCVEAHLGMKPLWTQEVDESVSTGGLIVTGPPQAKPAEYGMISYWMNSAGDIVASASDGAQMALNEEALWGLLPPGTGNKVVGCPLNAVDCDLNTGSIHQSDWLSLRLMIIHLNDRHRATREFIADWLETLDIDLTLKKRKLPQTDNPHIEGGLSPWDMWGQQAVHIDSLLKGYSIAPPTPATPKQIAESIYQAFGLPFGDNGALLEAISKPLLGSEKLELEKWVQDVPLGFTVPGDILEPYGAIFAPYSPYDKKGMTDAADDHDTADAED